MSFESLRALLVPPSGGLGRALIALAFSMFVNKIGRQKVGSGMLKVWSSILGASIFWGMGELS